jgi:hypothetical protein
MRLILWQWFKGARMRKQPNSNSTLESGGSRQVRTESAFLLSGGLRIRQAAVAKGGTSLEQFDLVS